MLHYLHVGHFERDSNGIRFEQPAPRGPWYPVVTKPLSSVELTRLVTEVTGEKTNDFPEEWSCGLTDRGYLVCDLYTRNDQEIEFVTRLIERQNCMLYERPGNEMTVQDWQAIIHPVPAA